MSKKHTQKLVVDHSPENIRERIKHPHKHSYLGDAVLGGIDGCITTFAIVASAVGAGLPKTVALVLGLANLTADGFSMAVSNYQAAKSRADRVRRIRAQEEQHIELIPEGEKEEIRQIFQGKGFSGTVLEKIVETITSERTLWIDTMLKEEHGLQIDMPSAYLSGITTFLAFLCVGLLPLLPFMIPTMMETSIFPASAIIAAVAFFVIGAAKGSLLQQSIITSGLNTLAIGGIAASLAYVVGDWSRQWLASLGF
jgi:VIT1/CCC1 family predicted Fe2+/Mn2+ transporter